MLTLTALAFISPVFGLSLDLDPGLMNAAFDLGALTADVSVEPVGEAVLDGERLDDPPTDPSLAEPRLAMPEATDTEAAIDPASVATAESEREASDDDGDGTPDIGAQMARRARFARAHKRLGIATWGAMTVATITGTLQYANLYGFFAPLEDTRCVRGNAFFGQRSCSGTPVLHASSAGLTAALYYTTFGLSFAMPDPIGLDRGDSDSARRLRQHKRLRWIHFTGMALQGVLGTLVANSNWIGLDRTNDYRAVQALATVHLLSGYATYGALTYAGSRMAF